MNLALLMELQKQGEIKVDPSSTVAQAIVGENGLTDEQCKVVAQHLGWTTYGEYKAYEVINKTDKFISSLRRHLKPTELYANTHIEFRSRRIHM